MHIRIISLALAFYVLSASAHAAPCEGFQVALANLEQTVTQASQREGLMSKPFITSFPTQEKLEQWTETSTSGGGSVTPMEFQGRKLLLSSRSYTSGVKTADLAVYQQTGSGWQLIKNYPLVRGSWIEALAKKDRLVFRRDDNHQELLVLSSADLVN